MCKCCKDYCTDVVLEEEQKAEIVEAEEPAEPAAETADSEQFFAYDQQYAKKKKTYSMPAFKTAAVVLTVCAAVFLVLGFVLAFPDANDYVGMAVFGAALLIALFGIFVVPVFHNYKIKAIFKSFLTDGDKLWALEFTPNKAIAGSGVSAQVQSHYDEYCINACRDRVTVAQIVANAKAGNAPEKKATYKKVKIICMSNIKVVKAGKHAQLSYVDAKGRTKKVKIADCYPGLFEYINK